MMKRKILYVDVPFYGIHGGDKNRSHFLWEILKENFNTDILLLIDSNNSETINEHYCENNTYYLKIAKGKHYKSRAIYNFSKKERTRFTSILKENRYDLILFRFISTGLLAIEAKKILPKTQIIVDVDMLFSRIAAMNWKDNQCIKNKYFYFEKKKLERSEERRVGKEYRR